ncbi:uncharacterized protein LOC132556065 [Ylistrum balloti]|uniref:uncharacterized protein LOC132556065 n=1 Tax=Ylistrum balloti TaxID=509963 RepID=UPI002905A556|nr:uncharacterized protein LOC132556065 [Ylistrum balloti]
MTSDLETKTLLDNHQEEERTEKSPSDSSTSLMDIFIRVVLIILFVIGLQMGGLTKNQYVYKWVEENSNSSTNVMNTSYDSTSTTISPDPCGGSVSAKSEKKDQSAAALWLLYFSLCEHGIAIPMIMMYSSYSDFVGRKPLMMISCIGFCFQFATKSFIVYKNLSLIYFFIPCVLTGISGGHYPFYIAMTASVADKTDNNKKRAFGIALFEAVTGVGVSTAHVGTGYLIKSFGYMYPMVAASGIFAVCFFITLFAIKDTRLPRSTKHITIGVHLKNIFGMFLSKSYILTGSVLTFNLTMLTIFLLLMAASDSSTIGVLYQLRSPFCWDSRKIGWYGFGTDILKYLFGLVVVKWLQMCLPDVTVIMITITSAIASSVITGFADTSLMLYISSGAGMLSLMSRPLLRAFSSNLIEKDKQGAVFGNTYVIENICSMLSKTVFSEIYARTQTFMAGFVFLIMGAFNLTSLIVFIAGCKRLVVDQIFEMDTASEQKPLLVNTDKQAIKSENRSIRTQMVFRMCLTFMYMVISEFGSLNQTLYIYNRASDFNKERNLTFTREENSTNACGSNQSRSTENLDQKLAAKWTWYFSLVSHGLGVPSLLLYGLYSDFIGRKPLLIISLTGDALRYGMMAFITHKRLPFVFFFVPYAVSGLTGNSYLFFIASTAAIADKTSYSQTRTVGLAIFEVLIGLGGSVAKISAGYLIHYSGYLMPMLICLGAYLTSSILVCAFVEETITTISSKNLTFCIGIKRIFGFFYDKASIIGSKNYLFVIAWSAFHIIHFARSSASGITTLYELRSPFCWTPEGIGWFGFVQNIVEFLLGLSLMKLLQYCVEDVLLASLGCLSNIGLFVVMGLASSNFMMYTALGAGVLSVVTFPVMRSILSRFVEADRQGILFANLYVMENLSSLAAGSIFNNLYSETEDWMPGLSFLVVASTFIIPLGLLM